MRLVRAPRRRKDDRQRGADAELHAHLFRHAEQPEELEQDRHDDGAAANPEEAGENAGDDAGGDNPGGEPGQFDERDRGQRFGLATMRVRKVPIAGERISTVSPGFR